MEFLCFDPSRISEEAIAHGVEMIRLRQEMEWATDAFTQAVRSIGLVLINRRRFAKKILHRISVPTLIIHGNADRVVAPASAKWAAEERPDWTLRMMSGVGHIPMIEVPVAFAETVHEWLGAVAAY